VRYRPTVAEIDLEAIRHNVRTLKPPAAELMAVVKADGYGHGDEQVARAALEAGATWLGVALVEEGLRLREAGIQAPILVLSEPPSGSERDALSAGLTPTCYTEAGLQAVSAARPGSAVHVKVDTGMHRVGLLPERVTAFCEAVATLGLDLEGAWTHLARSEELDDPTTDEQLKRFEEVLAALEGAGHRPRYRHAANSGATIARPDAHLDLVRVGIATYGILPGSQLEGLADLRPAMTLRSRVSMVKQLPAGEAISYGHRYRLERESTIATVPIGYADGYMRALTNVGRVLIGGRRHPVAGVVTMDQLMVDCGDHLVRPGDEVVLIGRQGGQEIRAEEVAGWAGTIGYEVVTSVSDRVPRVHRG
jgi:alanine racemase